MVWAAVAAVAALLACSPREEARDRDIELSPQPSPFASTTPRPADTVRFGSDAAGGQCFRLVPARHALTGVLRREMHLGPPGYGETPAEDAQDTIVVLELPTELPVCADTAGGLPDSPVVRSQRLQLVGRVGAVRGRRGDTVTVYGRLEQRTWGWHYTPLVLLVDSIPALRGPHLRTTLSTGM